jgi:hypothetical protein
MSTRCGGFVLPLFEPAGPKTLGEPFRTLGDRFHCSICYLLVQKPALPDQTKTDLLVLKI